MTVIDTPGAALSAEAEEGGLAGEIARCLADLVTLDAPTLCLMLGEGNGGGALALLPADRVIAAQHAWLSPLPPEGASAIVHRDVDHAAGDGPRPARAVDWTCATLRHRRPDRRREAGRRRRAGGVLPAGRRGAPLGARPAPRSRPGGPGPASHGPFRQCRADPSPHDDVRPDLRVDPLLAASDEAGALVEGPHRGARVAPEHAAAVSGHVCHEGVEHEGTRALAATVRVGGHAAEPPARLVRCPRRRLAAHVAGRDQVRPVVHADVVGRRLVAGERDVAAAAQHRAPQVGAVGGRDRADVHQCASKSTAPRITRNRRKRPVTQVLTKSTMFTRS